MTRAHVPPQSAGNDSSVRRVRFVSGPGGATWGSPRDGGMWVRTQCLDCNQRAGSRYDAAYADFSTQLRRCLGRARVLLADPSSTPPVWFAPGLVSRSILFGLLAVSPHVRVLHPRFAGALAAHDPDLRLPDGLRLRFALTTDTRARLAGPMMMQRVLGHRTGYYSSAEVYFPPLAWSLASDDIDELFDEEGWGDASDWPRYHEHRDHVDLRNLVRRLPVVAHPLRLSNDWIQLFSDRITPVLEADVPRF